MRGRRSPKSQQHIRAINKKAGSPPIDLGQSGILLDEFSLKELQEQKVRTAALLAYHWKWYSELAYQRKQIESQLKEALNRESISNFEIRGWQRAVKYKYSLHPLSSVGSLSMPGGRFNLGEIDLQNLPTFPALYLASDKDTALQETLGQVPAPPNSGLTPREIALTHPQSETIVSVNGVIERVFDLRSLKSLRSFVKLMRNFSLSKELKEEAKRLGLIPPVLVQVPTQLMSTLLDPHWRQVPMQWDIPSNSQIFGHLVYLAGIEGIVYPSKFTGKDCVALFHHNFQNTSSYIELSDELPHPKIPRRVDALNWKICDQTPSEVIAV